MRLSTAIRWQGTVFAGIACPFVGAAVDVLNKRKAALIASSIAMTACITMFAWVDPTQWVILLVLAAVGILFYGLLQSTYNSLIMHGV